MKMKASELRIGNYILSNLGEETTVHSLEENKIRSTLPGGWVLDLNPKPIPLTHEWLVKLGFEKIYEHKVRSVYDFIMDSRFGYNDNFGLSNISSGITFMGNKFDNIKYVHQLQNFYHSITGTELPIKKD